MKENKPTNPTSYFFQSCNREHRAPMLSAGDHLQSIQGWKVPQCVISHVVLHNSTVEGLAAVISRSHDPRSQKLRSSWDATRISPGLKADRHYPFIRGLHPIDCSNNHD
jgi:hypothetical protein